MDEETREMDSRIDVLQGVPKLIVINVVAKPNQQFIGYELLQSLLAVGLRFGKMSIFHFHEMPNGRGRVLFSLASAVEPGTFDLSRMGSFSCPGLTFFMQLTDQVNAQADFDVMLGTAKQLADDLDGELQDQDRKSLTEVTIENYRTLIRKEMGCCFIFWFNNF